MACPSSHGETAEVRLQNAVHWGAVRTDHDQQAQAVGVFPTDTVFAN
jgi:hypothetical protein